MNMDRPVKTPTILRLALKVLLALGLLWVLVTLWAVILFSIGESAWEEDAASLVRWCDSSYYERDLPELYDTLTLYDLYAPTYDRYWEAVELTLARMDLMQARAEKQAGLDPAGDLEAAAQKVWDGLEGTLSFPENAGIFTYLTERLP